VLLDAVADAAVILFVHEVGVLGCDGGVEDGEEVVGFSIAGEALLEAGHGAGCCDFVAHIGTERASGGNRKRISMMITAKTKNAPMKNRV
jgi:hypothetical protein